MYLLGSSSSDACTQCNNDDLCHENYTGLCANSDSSVFGDSVC